MCGRLPETRTDHYATDMGEVPMVQSTNKGLSRGLLEARWLKVAQVKRNWDVADGRGCQRLKITPKFPNQEISRIPNQVI